MPQPDPGAILPARRSTAYRLPPDPADRLPPMTPAHVETLQRGADAADIPPSVWDGARAADVTADLDGAAPDQVAAAIGGR